jgi:hypothetical protein
VAFVLDATSPNGDQHLFEIAFLARDVDSLAEPQGNEDDFSPSFEPLGSLEDLALLPRIAEQIKGFSDLRQSDDCCPQQTAAYLGNVWSPSSSGLAS